MSSSAAVSSLSVTGSSVTGSSATGPSATGLKVAVEPECWRHDTLAQAVVEGGGEVVTPDQAVALVWVEPDRPDLLPPILDANPKIKWVQLPYAGVESFSEMLHARPEVEWTCAKGVYAEPVAEHVLTLALAGMRGLGTYAAAATWEAPQGSNLIGARVTVLGGGGITESLLALLAPFNCQVNVIRRSVNSSSGTSHGVTVGTDALTGATALTSATGANTLTSATVHPTSNLHAVLPETDLLVLALALTPETTGIIAAPELSLLPEHAWLINVARGRHVVTDDLVNALRSGSIAGAGLDVTDPEPLPDGHPLWDLPNCIITPHIANTPEMGLPLLAKRVRQNVALRMTGQPLIGPIDIGLGY